MQLNVICKLKSKISPGLFLLFSAPVLGELLSAHQTPLEFFNPLFFILTSLPYGFGAILCRELTLKWQKGWISFFLLSFAYGIYEEGIVIRSFFNLNWSELGALFGYNNFMGLNLIYSFGLMHFHVLISIWCSVALAEIIYSNKKNERWVFGKKLLYVIIGLALWLPAGWFMTQYITSFWQYFICILIFIVLIFLARFIPNCRKVEKRVSSFRRSFWFFLIGFVNVTSTFVIIFILPEIGIFFPLWQVIFALLFINIGTFVLLFWITSGFRKWNSKERFMLVCGLLSFFIVMSLLRELEGFSGNGVFAVLAIWFLVLVWKKIGK